MGAGLSYSQPPEQEGAEPHPAGASSHTAGGSDPAEGSNAATAPAAAAQGAGSSATEEVDAIVSDLVDNVAAITDVTEVLVTDVGAACYAPPAQPASATQAAAAPADLPQPPAVLPRPSRDPRHQHRRKQVAPSRVDLPALPAPMPAALQPVGNTIGLMSTPASGVDWACAHAQLGCHCLRTTLECLPCVSA